MKLQSDIHKTLQDLESDRYSTVEDNRPRLADIKILYRFYNMRNQYTDEEKDKMGRDEVIQFGSSFESAQNFITPIESMVTGSKNLIKFTLDTNNPNIDIPLSTTISKILSKHIINDSSKFTNTWNTLGGFCFLKAGGFVVWDDKDAGLFPRLADSMLFPASTNLEPDAIRGCYEEIDMGINDLRDILVNKKKGFKKQDSKEAKKIQGLINVITTNIKGAGANIEEEEIDLELGDKGRYEGMTPDAKEKVTVWKYYEVRMKDNGSRYVSSILFARRNLDKADDSIVILDQEENIGKPNDWIVMLVSDLEIGGSSLVDTMRGIGEAHFEPSMALEMLKNRQLDGAMIASVPLFSPNGANRDELLKFEFGESNVLPDGDIKVVQIPDTSKALDSAMNNLNASVSNISRSERQNTGYGQELLRQQQERVENGKGIKGNRLYKIYKSLDKMLAIMSKRVFTLELDKEDCNTDDYDLIKIMQHKIDLAIVEHYGFMEGEFDKLKVKPEHLTKAKEKRKELSAEMYNTPLWYSVEANRQAVGIDRQQEISTAEFIMGAVNSGAVGQQQSRQLMKLAFTLATMDEDIAELAYRDSPIITTNQTHIAQAEWTTIQRRATSGNKLEINDTDDDIIHVENHLLDAISDVNRHNIEKWGEIEVMRFSISMDHIGDHLARMRDRPETVNLVNKYYPTFQETVKSASKIIQDVMAEKEKNKQTQEGSLEDEKLKAEIAQTLVETQIMAEKHGLSLQEAQRLNEQSKSRQNASEQNINLNKRRQYHKEIIDQQKLNTPKR